MTDRSAPYHPFLLGLFPILALYAQNVHCLSLRVIWPSIGVVLCGTLILLAVHRCLLRNTRKAALLSSFGLLLAFSHGPLHSLTQDWTVAGVYVGSGRALLMLDAGLFAAVCYCLWRSPRELVRLERAVNIFSLTLLAVAGVTLAGAIVRGDAGPVKSRIRRTEVSFDSQQRPEQPPDIYYIVLDAYTRSDVLREVFNYDNHELIDYLRARGFYVADQSSSNYPWTCMTLASVMNLTYLEQIYPHAVRINPAAPSGHHALNPLRQLIRESQIVELLKQRFGYRFVAFDTGYEYSRCRAADRYLSADRINLGEFEDALLAMTPIPALQRHWSQRTTATSQHARRVRFTLDQLPLVSTPGTPTFTFAHILSPHRPFIFDAQGRIAAQGRPCHLAYRAQVAYISQRIRQVIEQILARSTRPPVIILHGDHGLQWLPSLGPPASAALVQKTRFSILLAVSLPGKKHDWLYPTITPVNLFRGMLRHQFGAKLELLPDRRYWAYLERPWSHFDLDTDPRLPRMLIEKPLKMR